MEIEKRYNCSARERWLKAKLGSNLEDWVDGNNIN